MRSVQQGQPGYLEDCAEGEPGEFVCRGANLMSGYLQADVGSPFSSDATGRWSVAPPARAPQPPPTPPRR